MVTSESLPSQNFDVMTLITGGEEELLILEKRNSFFEQCASDLGLDITKLEIKESALGHEEPGKFSPSDDWLHLLLLTDEIVACVIDRRDDWNNHQLTFFQRPLTRQGLRTLELLREQSRDSR